MKCAMGGDSGISFTRVNHQELGVVLICDTCLLQEKDQLRPLPHRSGCGCVGECHNPKGSFARP